MSELGLQKFGGRSAEHVAVVGKHGGNVPETLIDPVARRCNERGAHASSVRLRIERISSFSDAWSEGGQRRSSRADVECVEPVNRRTAQVAAQAGVDATRV